MYAVTLHEGVSGVQILTEKLRQVNSLSFLIRRKAEKSKQKKEFYERRSNSGNSRGSR